MKFSHKTLVIALETAAVLTLLLAIALGVFVWRVSQGPISIAFAREYVAEALSSPQDGFSVTFEDLVFSWPSLEERFQLDMTGLTVKKNEQSIHVAKASVGLSRRALVFGRIRPVSVIIREPSLELVRAADGTLNFALPQGQNTQSDPGSLSRREDALAGLFKDMAHRKRGSILARLREFHIVNAQVAVRDHQARLSWYLSGLNFDLMRDPRGVAAAITAPLPGGRTQEAALMLDMVYRLENDDFRIAGRVRDINPSILSRFMALPGFLDDQDLYFSGDIQAALDTNLTVQTVDFRGAVPEGSVLIEEEYDAPIAVQNLNVESRYDATTHRLSISRLTGVVGGIPFEGQAEGFFEEGRVQFPVQLNVKEADVARLPPLIPKSEHNGEAYEWLGQKITAGTFREVALDAEFTGLKQPAPDPEDGETWSFDLAHFVLDFSFERADVFYHETLMPAKNASGKGRLDLVKDNALVIREARAEIQDIQARDVTIKVTDLMTKGAGFVEVNGKIEGPVKSALAYIADEPVNMGAQEIGLDPAQVEGTIAADIRVALPTVKDVPKDAVEVSIKGTLDKLKIPDVVEGLTLSGGPLTLATEPGGFRINGGAQLADRAVTLDWHQYFESTSKPYSMQVKAQIGADRELRNHFGVDLDDYISGTMPVDVVYTAQANGDAVIDISGDLNPVRIYIDPFKFEKPVGMPGSVTAQAILKKDRLTEVKKIEIKSRDFKTSNVTLGFEPRNGLEAELVRGKVPEVTLGKTKMAVDFTLGPDNVMAVQAKGPVFDLVPFLKEAEVSSFDPAAPKEKQHPMRISLTAPEMIAQNQQSAKDTKTYIELDDDGDITRLEYDASVGKAGKLSVRFRPDETGKRIFRLDTNDAGAALYTFGLYENIFGGKLVIYGEPKGDDLRGNLYGTMQMENFRVVKAPALASLLSLMSLTGVSQLLTNQGLVFSKLESGFEWRFRKEGNLLIIKDGKTSGSSIGLTFSGVVDRGKKTTDVAGTIIPMTEVNSILSQIPIVGDILGGAGGLIAATYSMKGPTSNPKVTVNPLSVLAPGILRRILFEGGYESKIPADPSLPQSAP